MKPVKAAVGEENFFIGGGSLILSGGDQYAGIQRCGRP